MLTSFNFLYEASSHWAKNMSLCLAARLVNWSLNKGPIHEMLILDYGLSLASDFPCLHLYQTHSIAFDFIIMLEINLV